MTADRTAALEPCPFCGFQFAEIHTHDEDGGPHIECGGCGTRSDVYATEAEVIAAWNRRPTAKEADRMRDALEAVDKYLDERMGPPAFATHGKNIRVIVRAALLPSEGTKG